MKIMLSKETIETNEPPHVWVDGEPYWLARVDKTGSIKLRSRLKWVIRLRSLFC